VPKYKTINAGSAGISSSYKPASPEEVEQTKQALQPNSENIIAERSKVIARLHNETAFGYTVITTKQHLSADKFDSLDPEIWSQMGDLLQEIVKKMETNLDFHDFLISLLTGERAKEITEIEKENTRVYDKHYDTHYYKKGELKLIIFPKKKMSEKWVETMRDNQRPIGKDGQKVGTMENERIAEKLRDPEGYYEK
jgi:diadenosine tetraphosphate (Ap4A) HIT family hydrolase